MSSIDELKKCISDVFEYVRKRFPVILEYIKPFALFRIIIKYIYDKIKSIQNIFTKKQKITEITTIEEKQDCDSVTISIDVDSSFIYNIIKYIEKNADTCELSMSDIKSIEVKNKNNIKYQKCLKSFKINYCDMIIESNDTYSFCIII